MSAAEPADLSEVVLAALRRVEKEIHAAADRIALALYVSKLVDLPEFRAQVEEAEQWIAEGCPGAVPAEEFLASVRARLEAGPESA